MPTFWKQFKLNYTHNSRGGKREEKKSASETAIKTVAVFFRSLLFGAAFKLPFLIVLHNNSMQHVFVCVCVCACVCMCVLALSQSRKKAKETREKTSSTKKCGTKICNAQNV